MGALRMGAGASSRPPEDGAAASPSSTLRSEGGSESAQSARALSTTNPEDGGAAAASSVSIASRSEGGTESAQSAQACATETLIRRPVVKVVEASEPEAASGALLTAESAAAAAYFESGYEAAAAYMASVESLSAVPSVDENSKPPNPVYDEMLAAKLGAIGDLSTTEPRPGARPGEVAEAPASDDTLYREAAAAYSYIMM